MELKDAVAKVEQVAEALEAKYAEAEKEVKAFGETTKATAEAIKALEGKLEDLNVKYERNLVPTETKVILPGKQFTESQQYKDMIARGIYESAPYEVKEVVSSAAASAGDLIVPQRVPGIIVEPERELRIRDLLAQGRTTSNSIEYVRETLFTSAAAKVNESQEGTLVSKPESTLRFDKESVTVETIAHWIPVSRQAIADAAQLQSHINTRLMYGLKLVEEGEILDDLLDAAQAYDATIMDDLDVATPTRIDHIRGAILQARLAEYPVSGVALHPTDWAAIELLKDTTGKYLWVTVPEGGVARLWRVPVVETTAMTQGSFLLGAFRMAAQVWDREGPSIRISEHHASYFIQNMVAVLCEERLAVTVYRPQALVTGPFEAGS